MSTLNTLFPKLAPLSLLGQLNTRVHCSNLTPSRKNFETTSVAAKVASLTPFIPHSPLLFIISLTLFCVPSRLAFPFSHNKPTFSCSFSRPFQHRLIPSSVLRVPFISRLLCLSL